MQTMSAALATVTAGWEQLGAGKSAEAEHSSRVTTAAQALDAFDAAVTSHMIVASANAFRSQGVLYAAFRKPCVYLQAVVH